MADSDMDEKYYADLASLLEQENRRLDNLTIDSHQHDQEPIRPSTHSAPSMKMEFRHTVDLADLSSANFNRYCDATFERLRLEAEEQLELPNPDAGYTWDEWQERDQEITFILSQDQQWRNEKIQQWVRDWHNAIAERAVEKKKAQEAKEQAKYNLAPNKFHTIPSTNQVQVPDQVSDATKKLCAVQGFSAPQIQNCFKTHAPRPGIPSVPDVKEERRSPVAKEPVTNTSQPVTSPNSIFNSIPTPRLVTTEPRSQAAATTQVHQPDSTTKQSKPPTTDIAMPRLPEMRQQANAYIRPPTLHLGSPASTIDTQDMSAKLPQVQGSTKPHPPQLNLNALQSSSQSNSPSRQSPSERTSEVQSPANSSPNARFKQTSEPPRTPGGSEPLPHPQLPLPNVVNRPPGKQASSQINIRGGVGSPASNWSYSSSSSGSTPPQRRANHPMSSLQRAQPILATSARLMRPANHRTSPFAQTPQRTPDPQAMTSTRVSPAATQMGGQQSRSPNTPTSRAAFHAYMSRFESMSPRAIMSQLSPRQAACVLEWRENRMREAASRSISPQDLVAAVGPEMTAHILRHRNKSLSPPTPSDTGHVPNRPAQNFTPPQQDTLSLLQSEMRPNIRSNHRFPASPAMNIPGSHPPDVARIPATFAANNLADLQQQVPQLPMDHNSFMRARPSPEMPQQGQFNFNAPFNNMAMRAFPLNSSSMTQSLPSPSVSQIHQQMFTSYAHPPMGMQPPMQMQMPPNYNRTFGFSPPSTPNTRPFSALADPFPDTSQTYMPSPKRRRASAPAPSSRYRRRWSISRIRELTNPNHDGNGETNDGEQGIVLSYLPERTVVKAYNEHERAEVAMGVGSREMTGETPFEVELNKDDGETWSRTWLRNVDDEDLK